ncbi:hypothetical protein NN561_019458 [Cricetulus griseus]
MTSRPASVAKWFKRSFEVPGFHTNAGTLVLPLSTVGRAPDSAAGVDKVPQPPASQPGVLEHGRVQICRHLHVFSRSIKVWKIFPPQRAALK